MRIGFDAVCLVPPFTGIPNYVLHLVLAMLSAPRPRQHEFLGFDAFDWRLADRPRLDALRINPQAQSAPAHLATRLRRKIARHPSLHGLASLVRANWFRTTLPRQKVDLYHAFMSRPPGRTGNVPVIPVVYDLSFLRYPELHPRARVNWLAPVEAMCRSAPMIHTISHAVRDEIVTQFGRRPESVAVIEPGVAPIYRDTTAPDSDILLRLDVTPGRYVLSVSTLEPRKNFKTLLTAYRALTAAERRRMPLLLVGTRGWGDTDMADSLDALTAEGTLRLTGYVSDHDLRTLYRHARALFYASLYEGYGMPITEALALGCPVVVSNTSSMPEAACGQGRTVAPLDVDGWRGEFSRALVDDAALLPAARDGRRDAVAHLTWARSAEATFGLYDAVMSPQRSVGRPHDDRN